MGEQIEKEKTAVSKWLQDYHADEEFINEFYKQGYYNVGDLDNAAIDAIVKEKKPGIAKTLKNALANRNKRVKGEPMAPPELPAGKTYDLSNPELEDLDGIKFEIPKSLGPESTKAAIISPNNIKRNEWVVIARGANLLYAYDMDCDKPKWAKTPILDWKVPVRDDFARSEISHAEVTTELTYSDEIASYVSSGFDTESATAGYAFCAVSVERKHKHMTAEKSDTKKLVQLGMWKYPRVQIYLDKCTVTSMRFISAIQEALEAEGELRFSELDKVFNEYGHVIPSGVLLGGQLCYKQIEEQVKLVEQHKKEDEFKAAAKAVWKDVSASIGAATGSASDEKKESYMKDQFTSFTNQGGDSLLCTNPPAWAETVKDPANWAVIDMEGMRPTVDLLDDDLRQQVLDAWSTSFPAILDPLEIEGLIEGQGVLYPNSGNDKLQEVMQENSGFAAAMRHCDQSRGSVHMVSSSPSNSGVDPKEGEPGTAAGAAYAHKGGGDFQIEYNSICLPVPHGGNFKTRFESTEGNPAARLIYIPSYLCFGEWREIVFPGVQCEATANEDGFLFVNIYAKENKTRGGVKGLINEKEVAGSFVHYYSSDKIQQQNFCMPVPKDENWMIRYEQSSGPDALVHAYWMPLKDKRWKMMSAVPITENTEIWAKTDGILHGWIRNTGGDDQGDRGTLKFYSGEDAARHTPEQLPPVAAAMHLYYNPNVRADHWVKYSSVMLPISRGTPYKAVFEITSQKPQAEIFWTAIVPRWK